MELYKARPVADRSRKNFFDNMKQNRRSRDMLRVLCKLEKSADSCHKQIIRNLREALHKWYDIYTHESFPATLGATDIWDALRTAWTDPGYFFSIGELHFIMALTATNVEYYVHSVEAGFKRVERSEKLQAMIGSSGCTKRVVYDGKIRGHFSRLLSQDEWNAFTNLNHDDAVLVASSYGSRSRCENSSDALSLSCSESSPEVPAEDNAMGMDTENGPIVESDDLICKPCFEFDAVEAGSMVAENGSNADPSDLSSRLCLGCDAGCVGAEHHKLGKGTPSNDQTAGAADKASDLEWEDADDVSENSDLFHVEVDPEKDFTTFEDEVLERVDRLVAQLRDRPLLPLDPRNTAEPFRDLHSGVRLPLLHCAFAGCCFVADVTGRAGDNMLMHWGPEWTLFTHLLTTHRDAFHEEFTSCGMDPTVHGSHLKNETKRRKVPNETWQDDLFLQVISVYMKAVCVRQQRSMPDVGPCIDRRILRIVNMMLPDIKAMMCFGCAQIHAHVPLWERMYNPSQYGRHEDPVSKRCWTEHSKSHRSQNAIEMYAVERSLAFFCRHNERNFRLHFDLRQFKERYASDLQTDGNPFRNTRILEENQPEWIRHIRFPHLDKDIGLLCCPEDVQRCKKCLPSPMRLCNECRIPLCTACAGCIVHNITTEIPMILANDNFWGYTTDLIFRYKVRWLEAAIVQPCWTSMIVCYVEGDYGHLLNEEVQQQQFRTRVRGTAHSFHMPWEQILEELREHCLEKEIMEPIPRKAECLKYILRVHLRIDKVSMEKVLRQLTVRPFVLLQLLYYLIEQNHSVFRGRGTAQELQAQMRAAVQREYPVSPEQQARPEEDQEWFLPTDYMESLNEATTKKVKRRFIIKEKNATPGDGEISLDNTLADRRPFSVVTESSGQASTDPATLRENTMKRFKAVTTTNNNETEESIEEAQIDVDGNLKIQIRPSLIPQWHGKYFSQILPFVIPFMVSGPDYEFYAEQKRWRRRDLGGPGLTEFLKAPWVSASARRCKWLDIEYFF